MITRVGLVAGIVLFLVGFALYESFNIIWRGGIIDHGDYVEVDLKAMSSFEMDQFNATLADIPEKYRKLDGKKVLLQGEIAPTTTSARGADNTFSLCYSVAKCCFSGPPKIQHFVECAVPPGKTFSALGSSGQVAVYGTFHVTIKKTGDAIQSVFQLDVQRVEPAA
jgi:hypothetical protein